jgi:hypothetical protein
VTQLQMLAAAYGVVLVDADGFDLEPADLRYALLLVLAAKRDELRVVVRRLEDKPGNPCPPLFAGELRAARFALAVLERDLAALLPRKVIVETTGVELSGRRSA